MPQNNDSQYVPALGFRWLTPAYDGVVRATTRERTVKSALIDQADFKPGQRILDLACGTGTLAVWIKQRHPQANVYGIDGDTSILSFASLKAQQAKVAIQFDHGLSVSLPYPDACFDRVVSSLFFHHLTWRDKQRTAQEIHRVMHPGGELHVADWGRASGLVMRGAFLAVQLLDGFETTQDNVDGRLMALFADAGFADVSQKQTFSTICGTMALYCAAKPGDPALHAAAPPVV